MTALKVSFSKSEIVLFIVFILFSAFLMTKTFGLTPEGNLSIASKAWSDFAATIPLIRSFSLGSNFPPEYPIFANAPIRYHFVFYFLVGLLERIGLPLSWALNIPSIIAFTLLLISIYLFAKYIFTSKAVGLLSVIFFLFNGSFGFLEFFKKSRLSLHTPIDVINNTDFSSFGPYDGKIVSAFWNLNIFTNQRHLALGYALFLITYLLILRYSKKSESFTFKKSFLLGIFIGLMPFIHYPVFGMLGILLLIAFMLYPKIRLQLAFAGLTSLYLAIPQILYMGKSNLTFNFIKIGYLIYHPTLASFLQYWILNLGVTLIFSILGFILSSKDQKKIFIPFLLLFIFGNIFQVSSEIAANHKFFNLYLIGANMFMAFFIVKVWHAKFIGKLFTVIVFPFLVLTGIIDFFPIINDRPITIVDIPNNKMATFIKENTPKNAVILNSSFLYHPASIAGRKILMGWPYFSWSAGYDTDKRGKLMTKIYGSKSKTEVCNLLKENNVDYFTIQDTAWDRDFPLIDLPFFNKNFTVEFSDSVSSLIDVSKNCK